MKFKNAEKGYKKSDCHKSGGITKEANGREKDAENADSKGAVSREADARMRSWSDEHKYISSRKFNLENVCF